MTRALNLYLDELIDVKYYLEVSSPGLDRKLKSSREYLIFKGKKAKIKLKRLIDESKEKVFDIRIGEYNGTDTLSVTRLSDNKQLDIKEEDILSIKLILELNRTGESANE
jgi:ribosome maturation factor RimP